MEPYAEGYYAARNKERIRSSAKEIIPLVLELVRPRSVIDVGCGTGEWLSVFGEYGVEDVWGVDGAYVNKEMLEIPEEHFIPSDLERPFHMDRKFDLVVSLEVAEHLPKERAETFVGSLTGLGPVVLFSAAIPHQGGRNHINNQWPEYWAKRFHDKGYVVIDCLRRKIWCNDKVEKRYRQNILMFAARGYLEDQPLLSKEHELHSASQLSVVHPEIYLSKIDQLELRVSKLKERNSGLKAQVHGLKRRNARLLARCSSRRYRLADAVAEKALRIPGLKSLKRRITVS